MKFLSYFTRSNNDRPVDRAQLIIDGAHDTRDESVAPPATAAAEAATTAEIRTDREKRGNVVANKKKLVNSSKDSGAKQHRNDSDESDVQSGRQRKDRGDTILSYFTRTSNADPQADTVHLIIADHDAVQDEPTTTTTTTESVVLEADQRQGVDPQSSSYEYNDERFLVSGSGRDPLLDHEEAVGCMTNGEGPDLCSSSAEIIEVTCVEEVHEDGEVTDKKKKRKILRKKVRKRVWRVMRSSWKYFRIGITSYAPLAGMFNWGINTTLDKTRRPTGTAYF